MTTSSASFASSRTAVSASSVRFPWEPQSSDRPAIFSLTITPISMKDIFFLTGALTVQCRSCCSVHGELLSPLLCSTLDCYNQLSSNLVSKCNSGPKCFKASKAIKVINIKASSWHGQRGKCPQNAQSVPLMPSILPCPEISKDTILLCPCGFPLAKYTEAT